MKKGMTHHVAPIPDQILVRPAGTDLRAQGTRDMEHLCSDRLAIRSEVLDGDTSRQLRPARSDVLEELAHFINKV